jgi:hypothetical protein
MSIVSNLVAITAFVELYLADNPVLKYFYKQLYRDFNPDITGYTLLFMVPPEFSAEEYKDDAKLEGSDLLDTVLSSLSISPQKIETLKDFGKVYPFMATDFTPPQTQIQNSQVQARTGALSYASDIMETQSISISFIESNPLTIYKFHLLWIEYIRDILRGEIKPDDKYISPDGDEFGAQDYLASLFIVKYIPDMKTISYIGKCIGVCPTALPSKELIGSRNTNEICILPFEYSCVAYREYVPGLIINRWIEDDLKMVLSNYSSSIFDTIKGMLGF